MGKVTFGNLTTKMHHTHLCFVRNRLFGGGSYFLAIHAQNQAFSFCRNKMLTTKRFGMIDAKTQSFADYSNYKLRQTHFIHHVECSHSNEPKEESPILLLLADDHRP